MKFIVIGIQDNPNVWFPPEVMRVIRSCRTFSGGKRHHDLVRHLLPNDAAWIEVSAPISRALSDYRLLPPQTVVAVFASGDPLFFGYATTLMREFPQAEVQVFPSFNSLQMLAHRMLLPYQDMKMVSQTGRPWQLLDEALIRQESLIGVLTDKYKTPQAIAQRMRDYGYVRYRMTVGECLGNPNREHVSSFDVSDAEALELARFQQPNCVILQLVQSDLRPRFGIPESEFHLLNGRINMITKAPIRLATLSALGLQQRRTLWDVGFCTGSVSIEARLQFPHLRVEAFEVRKEGEQLMRLNARKFGAPGIGVHIGDFLCQDLTDIPQPDAVFIGGHGGKLPEMVQRIESVLLPGGCIVFNSVSEDSCCAFLDAVRLAGLRIDGEHRIALDHHNPINIITAHKLLQS